MSIRKAAAFLPALRSAPSLGRFKPNDLSGSTQGLQCCVRDILCGRLGELSTSCFLCYHATGSRLHILNLSWDTLCSLKSSIVLKFVGSFCFCFLSISVILKRSISPRVKLSCSLCISMKLDQDPDLWAFLLFP